MRHRQFTPFQHTSSLRRCAGFFAVLCVVPAGSGCGATISKRTVTERIEVATSPPGAWVWRRAKEGRRSLGRAPRTVERVYQVTTSRFNRWSSWLWLLGTSGATAGSFGWYSAVDSGETGLKVTLMTTGILAGIMALGYIGQVIGGELNPVRERITPAPLTIGASLPGHLDAWSALKTPHGKQPLKLALSPGAGGTAAGVLGRLTGASVGVGGLGGGAKAGRPAAATSPVVAVFDIQDASRRLKPAVLDQLTEYLAAQVTAQAGYQVVPRRQLRARLAAEKRKTFKACFDAACQIELGKAVAAERSLATKLLRVGSRCAFTAVLYDLKRETSIQAASVDTACSLDALMGGVRQLAEKLAQ